MKILVANLGSTSFKHRLFDMPEEAVVARGSVDRIGSSLSQCVVEIGERRLERSDHVPDHGAAIRYCLDQLTDSEHGCLAGTDTLAAVGFKAVHGGRISGVRRIDDDVLAAMEEMSEVAPAHNPPYIAAMRQFAEQLPKTPLVAAFETGFHESIPDAQRYYAIPRAWSRDFHIRRFGFHGASHRYIADRMAQLTGRRDLRVISCHLGGSSSLCAIRNGKSAGTTLGMSPQSGLPHNNRVGDFDPFALPQIMKGTGMSLSEVLAALARESGLLGLSGTSGDIRDLEQAAASGDHSAELALNVYTSEVRRQMGGLLVLLGRADAIVFTGGIGENGRAIRQTICRDLDELGIVLDPDKNTQARGESQIHADASRTQIWVVPTHEELVVARQAFQLLKG